MAGEATAKSSTSNSSETLHIIIINCYICYNSIIVSTTTIFYPFSLLANTVVVSRLIKKGVASQSKYRIMNSNGLKDQNRA